MKDLYLEIGSMARSHRSEEDRVGMIVVYDTANKRNGIHDVISFEPTSDGSIIADEALRERHPNSHFMPLDENNQPVDTGELTLAEVIEMMVAASIKKFVEQLV